MLSERAIEIMRHLPECDPDYFGYLIRRTQNLYGEKLFIAYCRTIWTLDMLGEMNDFRKSVINESYERLWFEFVGKGFIPTHRWEGDFKEDRTHRIYLIRLETEGYKTYEKEHSKLLGNIISDADGHFSRYPDTRCSWSKIRVKNEARGDKGRSNDYYTRCYPFEQEGT